MTLFRPPIHRFRVLRERPTRAGIALDDLPGLCGSDSLTIHAASPEIAVARAHEFGHAGRLVALEIDADGRLVQRERSRAS